MSKRSRKQQLATHREIEAILQVLRSAGSDLQHSKRRYASFDFLGTVYRIHSQCRARDSLQATSTMLLRLTQDPSKKRHTWPFQNLATFDDRKYSQLSSNVRARRKLRASIRYSAHLQDWQLVRF